MPGVERVDPRQFAFDIGHDLAITARQYKPGPPERPDGMAVGIVQMSQDAPHNGEMHPDGDELLYVIAGVVTVTCDSMPDEALTMNAGDACIVRAGEWHKVSVVEPVTLLHITPGPNGDHRPLPGS